MTKETLIDIINNKTAVTTLNPSEAYIITLNCEEMSKDQMINLGRDLAEMLRKLGMTRFIIVPKECDIKIETVEEYFKEVK